MPTIFTYQYPQGIVSPQAKRRDPNNYTLEHLEPQLQAGIAIPEVNPFVAWALGAKTEIMAATPDDAVLTKINVDGSVPSESEYQVFVGAVGEERLLASSYWALNKRGYRTMQSPVIPAGSRVSVALARSVTDVSVPTVKLTVRDVEAP
jgi:hypothetical protein